MSKLHPTQHNYNEFGVNNCENYLSKMIKNKRSNNPPVDPTRLREREREERRVQRDKSVNRPTTALTVARPMLTAKAGPVIRVEAEPRRKPSTQEIVHQEVYNNNMATVEVTVRTVAPKGAEKTGGEEMREREPWGKILGTRMSDDIIQCNFGNFDPLRTLHFLSKELQLKLHSACPGDPSIHQIVNDMQGAMQRLPPDILSQLKAAERNSFQHISTGDHEPPVNIKKSSYYDEMKLSKHCQTVIIGDVETKKMQEQLEVSATKLEASCKEMETVCSKLRTERDELESMLLAEKETVVSLKKELQECVSATDEKINKEMKKASSEHNMLKKTVKDLQTQLESKENQATADLRALVDELRNKQLTVEQENTARRNELTMMKLEKDKMTVMLDCRDKQLKELRNELEFIQQLVSTQLSEFKAKPTFSTTSTMSSVSQIWNTESNTKSQNMGKSVHELFLNNDVMRRMLLNKELKINESGTITTLNAEDLIREQNLKLDLVKDVIQEIPQREENENQIKESQMTISDVVTDATGYTIRKLSSPSIKDMFAEIKRQAFKKLDVTLPPPPHKIKDKDTTPAESHCGLDSRASLSS